MNILVFSYVIHKMKSFNYKHNVSIHLLLKDSFLFELQFQLQMFDIVCSTSWANEDKCCELPALVRILLSLFVAVLY